MLKYCRKGSKKGKGVKRIGRFPEDLVDRGRSGKIKNVKGLCPDERGIVSQNARRNFVKMCGA